MDFIDRLNAKYEAAAKIYPFQELFCECLLDMRPPNFPEFFLGQPGHVIVSMSLPVQQKVDIHTRNGSAFCSGDIVELYRRMRNA